MCIRDSPYLHTPIQPHAHLRLRTPHARPPSPPAPTVGQALLHFLDRPMELPRSYIDEACPVFDCCCTPGAPRNVSGETRAALRTAAAAATGGSMPPRNAGTVEAPRLTEAPRLLVDWLEDSRHRTVVEGRLGGLQTEMTPTAAVAAAAALLVGIAAVARRRRRTVAATAVSLV